MQGYYGDTTRWFIGTVVDINDPLRLDRVKVRIHGVHSEDTRLIANDDLPWAQVVIPNTEGGSSGLGANSQLKERAQVFGFFLDGKNSQLPLVVGSIPKIETRQNDIGDGFDKASTDPALIAFGGFGEQIGPQTSSAGIRSNLADNDLKMAGSTNCEKIFNFFISKSGGSFSQEATCGMIGNFLQEAGRDKNGDINIIAQSSTDTAVVGGVTIRGFGIAQWNPQKKAGNRLGQLIKYSENLGLNYRSLYAQVQFVKFELETKPEFYGLSQLKRAKSVKEATLIFSKKYERPRAQDANNEGRIKFAEEQYRKLGRGAI